MRCHSSIKIWRIKKSSLQFISEAWLVKGRYFRLSWVLWTSANFSSEEIYLQCWVQISRYLPKVGHGNARRAKRTNYKGRNIWCNFLSIKLYESWIFYPRDPKLPSKFIFVFAPVHVRLIAKVHHLRYCRTHVLDIMIKKNQYDTVGHHNKK